MKKITIDRTQWARGPSGTNRLWKHDLAVGCCLGHLIHQVEDCSWDSLEDKGTPEVYYAGESFLTEIDEEDGQSYDNVFASAAIDFNDTSSFSDEYRESELIKLFGKNNFELEFYN